MNFKRKKSGVLAVLIGSLLLVAAPPSTRAQDCHGPPPPPGPGDGLRSTMRGGLQLGPPGRWWDDKDFAQQLGLSAVQARRMDDIFQANRGTLLRLFRVLEQEESGLEQMTTGNHLDEDQIFQQIDQVNRARTSLEKANAHMLLEIRKQMTDEQTARLDQHRPKPPR